MLTIVLPIPSRALSPNARCHWAPKSQITRMHRRRAKMATLEALNGQPAPEVAGYVLRFFFKTRQHRDDDNAAASCKAYRDGIADALRIDDHTLRMVCSPEMRHDPENPRLEITLCSENELPKIQHPAPLCQSGPCTVDLSTGSSTAQPKKAGCGSPKQITAKEVLRSLRKSGKRRMRLSHGCNVIVPPAPTSGKSAARSNSRKKDA